MKPPKKKPSPQFQFSAKGSQSQALGWSEYGLGALPILFWGTAFYFVAEALVYTHPGTLVWLRLTAGFIFFAALPVPAEKHHLGFWDWVKLTILSIMFLALPYTLFSFAQQWIDSSLAGMLIGVQPILTAVLASFFLGALPNKRNTLGLVFGLGGSILVALPNLGSEDSSALGIIFVFIAILNYAFATNFLIPLNQKWGSYFVTVKVLFLSSLVTMPYGIYGITQSRHSLVAYGAIAILGIGASAIAPFAFSALTSKVGATRAGSFVFLIPVVALCMGAFIRNENIEGLSLIGLGVVLIGTAVMGGADDRH